MSLTAGVERGRRRAILQLVVGGAVIAALVVAALWYGLSRGGDASSSPQATASPTSPATPTVAIPSTAGTWTPPPVSAGPLVLPVPTSIQRGVPLGYPHSTEGAISAAVHYTQAAVTLDVNRARTVGELAAAPSYLTAADDFAANVEVARRDLGLDPTGTTNGAYLSYRARAYLVMDATPSRVEVWVLGSADGAGPSTGGVSQAGPSIARLVMVWAEADWRLTDDTPTAAPPHAPEPGSTQAYEQGWRDLAIA